MATKLPPEAIPENYRAFHLNAVESIDKLYQELVSKFNEAQEKDRDISENRTINGLLATELDKAIQALNTEKEKFQNLQLQHAQDARKHREAKAKIFRQLKLKCKQANSIQKELENTKTESENWKNQFEDLQAKYLDQENQLNRTKIQLASEALLRQQTEQNLDEAMELCSYITAECKESGRILDGAFTPRHDGSPLSVSDKLKECKASFDKYEKRKTKKFEKWSRKLEAVYELQQDIKKTRQAFEERSFENDSESEKSANNALNDANCEVDDDMDDQDDSFEHGPIPGNSGTATANANSSTSNANRETVGVIEEDLQNCSSATLNLPETSLTLPVVDYSVQSNTTTIQDVSPSTATKTHVIVSTYVPQSLLTISMEDHTLVDSTNGFLCKCSLQFNSEYAISQHIQFFGLGQRFRCDVEGCGKTNFDGMKRVNEHRRRAHPDSTVPVAIGCKQCGVSFASADEYRNHLVKGRFGRKGVQRGCPLLQVHGSWSREQVNL